MKTKRVWPYCNGTGFIETEEDYPRIYPNLPYVKNIGER